jgi:protein ImuB
MHWLALHCPTLSLDCILRRWPAGLDLALAVTDVDGSRRLVIVATRTAQAGGVFAGQSVATALALLPDLVIVPRKPDDERSALNEAALAALRFTPHVALRDSGLVMEISASLRLFGGRRALKKDVVSTMKTQGLQVATAEAPTPHGAWLMAQENARRLDEAARGRKPRTPPSRPASVGAALDALPIAHLDHGRPLLRRLDGIGCTTLAHLRRLPVKGLARRFGPGLVDELARAYGDKPDPQAFFEAPSSFETRVELMARVETAEALVFASQRLLAQLAGWLCVRRAAVRGFTLRLHHDRWTRDAIEPTALAIALASPTSELDRLCVLVRERMEHLVLKAPVLELTLEAPVIVEEEEADGSLFPERDRTRESLARLLEKLTARLGPAATTRIQRVADHRPERAWRELQGDLLPASQERAPSRRSSKQGTQQAIAATDVSTFRRPLTDGCDCGPRPAWLLTPPQPLEVRSHRPYFESLPLDLVAGPERIESGWWDDAAATRDYFIAENAAGHLVWIYRERLPAPERPHWYLQGLFG